MNKQITIILGLVILLSLVSPILAETIILTDLSDEDWNFIAGETIIKEIEICHTLNGEKELFLTYKIEGNEYDLEGLTFSFSENPVTFEGCKNITFNINSQVNYKPDNFKIIIYAITSVSESQNYTAGDTIPLKYELEGVDVELEINSTGSGKVEIIRTSYNPKSDLSIPNLNIFFEINADANVEDNMDEAIIKVYYKQSEVNNAEIDEDTLRLYYYNDITQTWEKYDDPNGGVDTDDNYVWARITHFSIWGVFGNEEEDDDDDDYDRRGGGSCIYNKKFDWKCSEWSSCVDGKQTRTCKKYNNCYNTYGKPDEIQTCDDTIILPDDKDDKDDEDDEKGIKWWIWIIIVIVLILLILLIYFFTKDKGSEVIVTDEEETPKDEETAEEILEDKTGMN